MKKKVTKIEIVKYVAERGDHKGQTGEYIQLTLENRGKNWIAQANKSDDFLPITRPQSLVDIWKGFAEQLKDGKKTIEEVVPTEFREIDNVFKVNVPLDGNYYRLYRKDVVDASGKIIHKKGDYYMMDDGRTPQIYDSLNVLAIKYEDDDTGEMCWLQTPESIVRDMINRGYYAPVVTNTVSEDVQTVVSEAGSDEAPESGHEPTADELKAELERLKAKAANA